MPDVELNAISTHPKVENAITNVMKRIPKAELARKNALARSRGFSSLEAMLRAEVVAKVGPELQAEIAANTTAAAARMGAVQPGAYAGGGPLVAAPAQLGAAGASLPGPSPLPGAQPVAGMLPAAGQSAATQMSAAQRLATAAQGTSVGSMAPAVPMPAASATTSALEAIGAARPGAYSAGGPLSMLGKTAGWDNGLSTATGLAPELPAIGPAAYGPTAPTLATNAAQKLSSAAAGTVGSAPIAAEAASPLAAMAGGAGGALAGDAAAAGGGRIASLLGLESAGGAGLLGGMSKTRLGLQGFAAATTAPVAGKLADKINVGGKNSIWDQFTTGAAAGGVGGGIAGAGTGPGALLSAGAGALIGGVGNVLGNQLGWWGAKADGAAKTDHMDLAVSKLMNAADNAGLNNTQELAQALRAQAPLYEGKGGKKALQSDVEGLISKLPDFVMQQSAQREKLAYDSKFRAEAISNLQPRIAAMTTQYNKLADLYEQRGDVEFAQGLRANAQQQAAALISQVQQIPQQYALEKARNFAAQLEQARMSQQIGQMVNPSSSGGLEALAAG